MTIGSGVAGLAVIQKVSSQLVGVPYMLPAPTAKTGGEGFNGIYYVGHPFYLPAQQGSFELALAGCSFALCANSVHCRL